MIGNTSVGKPLQELQRFFLFLQEAQNPPKGWLFGLNNKYVKFAAAFKAQKAAFEANSKALNLEIRGGV